MNTKLPSSSKILMIAGLFFLGVGVVEILMGRYNTTSTVIGTIYVVGSIIVNTVVSYSLPLQVSNNLKPEVLELLVWADKNLPMSKHPDLCADFVEEFRKKFDEAKEAGKPTDTVSI
jgi:hypothetical protein